MKPLLVGVSALIVVTAFLVASSKRERATVQSEIDAAESVSSSSESHSFSATPQIFPEAAPSSEDEERESKLLELSYERLMGTAEVRHTESENVHRAPEEILEAGRTIARLENLGDRAILPREKIVRLLANCAEDLRLPTSVRAHCLASATRLSARWGEFFAFSKLNVERDVQTLADQLLIVEFED